MSRAAYDGQLIAVEALIEAVLESGYTASTKLICIRALMDGTRGTLPAGEALITLGRRVGVSRRTSFRAAIDLAGQSLGDRFGGGAR